jgi:hypothetical protein
MHPEAHAFVRSAAEELGPVGSVVEFGGRDVNETEQGLSIRELFQPCEYLAIDIAPGRGVDVVADCATWRSSRQYDVVICCEVLEHTDKGPGILESAWHALRPRGHAVFTMATDPRAPHSGVDGGEVQAGEYYANVSPDEFHAWATGFTIKELQVDKEAGDLRAVLVKI